MAFYIFSYIQKFELLSTLLREIFPYLGRACVCVCVWRKFCNILGKCFMIDYTVHKWRTHNLPHTLWHSLVSVFMTSIILLYFDWGGMRPPENIQIPVNQMPHSMHISRATLRSPATKAAVLELKTKPTAAATRQIQREDRLLQRLLSLSPFGVPELSDNRYKGKTYLKVMLRWYLKEKNCSLY